MKTRLLFLMVASISIATLSSQTSYGQLANWRTNGNASCGACLFGTTDFADIDFITNNVQVATLTESGNMGIGTASPSGRLHIEGGTDVELASGGFLILGATNSENISFDNNEIEARNNGAAGTLFLQNDGGDLNVSAGAMLLQGSTNNVGIGNTAPGALLHVGTTTGAKVRIGSFESLEDGGSNTIKFGFATLVPDLTLTRDLGTSTLAWDDCNCDDFNNISDIKEKENIKALSYGLKEVMQMKPVNYTMKRKPYEGNRLGFIAQDMIQLVPEVVNSKDWRQDENGIIEEVQLDTWGIDYGKLTAVLVSAIQQQQYIIEDKNKQLSELQGQVGQLQSLLVEKGIITSEDLSKNASASSITLSAARLEQNAPNPFSVSTTIKFYLPESAAKATISISDSKGNALKTVDISQRGSSQITISAFELPAGTYTYSLVVDDKRIDTKQMVLTR